MTIYQFETNSILSDCVSYDDGTRVFVRNAINIGAYVEVTVSGIPATGWYDLNINYTQGFGDSVAPWKLTINSSAQHILLLPFTGSWNSWVTKSFEKIYLTAGTNILRFTQYGLAVDLDYFELIYSTVQVQEMPEKLIYWTETGETLTSPARQNIFLTDTDFTSNNYDLTISTASNRCLICENTTAVTLTLQDINWEIDEPWAEIEIIRTGGAVAIATSGAITTPNVTTFDISTNGFCLLKHIKNKTWYLKGDLE